jgi:hypothetical protein
MTAELAPSRVLVGAQIPDESGLPALIAHGEPDDHLRWTVLLARVLGSSGGALLREAADICTQSRRVSWSQRLDALAYLLNRAPPPEGRRYRAALVDVDALDTGSLPPEDLWDNRNFCRQRGSSSIEG